MARSADGTLLRRHGVLPAGGAQRHRPDVRDHGVQQKPAGHQAVTAAVTLLNACLRNPNKESGHMTFDLK